MACILLRHVREGRLTKEESAKVRRHFLEHIHADFWTLFPVTQHLLAQVEEGVFGLPEKTFLRAGDAIHLLSAREAGFKEIWTNDRHLLAAAPHFGLVGRSV